jgi:hypothetical protein
MSVLLRLLLLLFGVVVLACDPGFIYRPRGWERVESHEWSTRIDGVEIRTGTYSDLISSTYFGPEFELANDAEDTVVIEDARLFIEGRSYPVRFSGAGELRWRSAAPGSTARVPLAWGFDDYAINVLGDRPRIVLDLRIGEEKHQLEIEYERIE